MVHFPRVKDKHSLNPVKAMQVLGKVTGTHQPGFQKFLTGLWKKRKREIILVGSVFLGPTGSCSAVWPCKEPRCAGHQLWGGVRFFCPAWGYRLLYWTQCWFLFILNTRDKIYIKTLYLVQHLIGVVREWNRHTGIYIEWLGSGGWSSPMEKP